MNAIRAIIVVIAILIFAIAALLFARARAADHRAFNERGAQLIREGKYKTALINLERALKLKPNYAEAYHNCGIAYGRLGRFGEAEESLRRALALEPDQPRVMFNLAAVLEKEADYQGALDLLARAEKRNADYPAARALRAKIYCRMADGAIASGDAAAAGELLLKAVASDPSLSRAHYALGELYRKDGKYEKAVAEYNLVTQAKAGTALSPRLVEAYRCLGDEYAKAGQHEKARDAYRRAIAIHPHDGELRYRHGVELLKTGQRAEAFQELEEAYRAKPDLSPDVSLAGEYVSRAREEIKGNRSDSARENLDIAARLNHAIDTTGERAALLVSEGDSASGAGDAKKALDRYREAEKLTPSLPSLDEKLARAHAAAGEGKEAIGRYEKLAAGDPGNKAYAAALGDLYLKAGEYAKAAEKFAALGDERRNDLLACYERLAEAEKNQAKALELYRKCLQLDPSSDDVRSRMYLALAKTGRHEEAVRGMEALLKKYPVPRSPPFDPLRMRAIESVRVEEGLGHLQGTHRWDFMPGGGSKNSLGILSVREGKQSYIPGVSVKEGWVFVTDIVYEGPDPIGHDTTLLIVHDGGKRTTAYLSPLRAPAKLWMDRDGYTYLPGFKGIARSYFTPNAPVYNGYRYILGLIYKGAEEKKKAKECADYHYRRAMACFRLGFYAESESEFKRAIVLCEEYFEAHLSYAGLLYTQKRYDDAAREVDIAAGIRPQDPVPVNDLGVVLSAQGRFQEAEQTLLRAVQMDDKFVTPSGNLAQLYKNLGRIKDQLFWEKHAGKIEAGGNIIEDGLRVGNPTVSFGSN